MTSINIIEFKKQINTLKKFNRVFFQIVIVGALFIGFCGYRYLNNYHFNLRKLKSISYVKVEKQQSVVKPEDKRRFDINFFERNIFIPYRDAPPPGNNNFTQEVIKFKNAIRVVGITLDEEYEVLIEYLEKKETVLLVRGESIAGATLIEINDKKMVFELGNNRIEIEP